MPGAIFTTNLRIPIKHGDAKDPALHRGKPIGISADEGFDVNAGVKASGYSFFGASTKVSDLADVALSFPDARIVDMDLPSLIAHVEASSEVIDAAKRGQIPLIVIKSYYGTPLITIMRKSSASAEAWAKVKAGVEVGANTAASDDKKVSYKAGEEIVFAFETSQINFNPFDLNSGKITVTIASLPARLYAIRETAGDAQFADIFKSVTGVENAVANEERPTKAFCTFFGAC